MLDFAVINSNSNGWYDMDNKTWEAAINNFNGSLGKWNANCCLFFESSQDWAVWCGCVKFMLLSTSSTEVTKASSNGWWTGSKELINLCDKSYLYIVANSSTASGVELLIMCSLCCFRATQEKTKKREFETMRKRQYTTTLFADTLSLMWLWTILSFAVGSSNRFSLLMGWK